MDPCLQEKLSVTGGKTSTRSHTFSHSHTHSHTVTHTVPCSEACEANDDDVVWEGRD